jgi:hypothetical protein
MEHLTRNQGNELILLRPCIVTLVFRYVDRLMPGNNHRDFVQAVN